MARSCFSVEYQHPEYPDNYCAADWDHWKKRQWVPSWKSKSGSTWHPENDGLNRFAYEAILSKFRLQNFRAELPIAKIQFMSPADLLSFRSKRGFTPIEVFSDTPGDRQARAEEYE